MMVDVVYSYRRSLLSRKKRMEYKKKNPISLCGRYGGGERMVPPYTSLLRYDCRHCPVAWRRSEGILRVFSIFSGKVIIEKGVLVGVGEIPKKATARIRTTILKIYD